MIGSMVRDPRRRALRRRPLAELKPRPTRCCASSANRYRAQFRAGVHLVGHSASGPFARDQSSELRRVTRWRTSSVASALGRLHVGAVPRRAAPSPTAHDAAEPRHDGRAAPGRRSRRRVDPVRCVLRAHVRCACQVASQPSVSPACGDVRRAGLSPMIVFTRDLQVVTTRFIRVAGAVFLTDRQPS